MVCQFLVEPMHLLDQGVGKIILNSLFKRQIFGGPRNGADIPPLNEVFSAYHRFKHIGVCAKVPILGRGPMI